MGKSLLLLFMIVELMLGYPECSQGDEMKGPPASCSLSTPVLHEETGLSKPLLAAIRFFQEYISPMDGDRCQFSPTCSSFGARAIREHGPWPGLLMTADRLMRCSYLTDPAYYPQLPAGRLADPVPVGNGENE